MMPAVGVQAVDAGVAPVGALLGVAVSRPDGVIEIDEGHLLGAGQDRGRCGKSGQQSGGHGVELADVTEGEAAQERAQRRGRPDLVEQPAHPAVPQQIHVIDAVRAGDHPATSASTFAAAFAPPFAAIWTRSASRDASPHRAANASTAASPAHDTRFGSSNRTDIARRA